MRYFFRGIPDGTYFRLFSLTHILLMAIALIGSYLIYKYRYMLQDKKLSNIFRKTVGITLLTQQFVLYMWYFITGYSSMKESLPLYNCRVAIILTALALLTNKDLFKNISVYWGMYGAILSLIVVEGDPFVFPHYTIVSFFIGHIFLLWGSLYFLIVDDYRLNKQNLRITLKLTTIYHFILLIFDLIFKANYDYLIEPPVLKGLMSLLPQIMYSLIAIIVFDLLILITYFVVNAFLHKSVEYSK